MDWAKDKIGGGDKAPRLSDLADTLNLKDGKPHELRAVGPARRIARHWFTTMSKEGKKNKPFPKMCLAYNSDSGEFDGKCPYCDIDPGTPRIEVHQNFIDRKLQEDAPRKIKPPRGTEKELVRHFGEKMFLKDGKNSEAYTPVVLAALPPSPGRKIQDYAELNTRKTEDGKVAFGPNHPKFGFDVIIKWDGSRSPAEQYSVMKGENTKLNDEERRYLRWALDLEKPDTLKAAKVEAEKIAKRLAGAEEDEDDDDDDRPKKSKGKKKSRQVDVEDEDFDDDEDDAPKKKKKSKSRDEDDEDDDEDEDDRRSKKSSKSKKRRDDDEEDEDDEPRSKKKKSSKKDSGWDDDDDEDDDEPKSKKKKRKVEEDDDDDEDDEDDRPKKKSKTTSKKRSRDEDEDDDEDEPKSKKKKRSRDDDDDDEDDPPFKPSKSKKKKSRDDDDDEDEDWDDGDDD